MYSRAHLLIERDAEKLIKDKPWVSDNEIFLLYILTCLNVYLS